MGLDMNWYHRTKDGTTEVAYLRKANTINNYILEAYKDELESDGNCNELLMTKEFVDDLVTALKDGDLTGQSPGFFWGGEWTQEELEEFALPELLKVQEAVTAGKKILYVPWW